MTRIPGDVDAQVSVVFWACANFWGSFDEMDLEQSRGLSFSYDVGGEMYFESELYVLRRSCLTGIYVMVSLLNYVS